MEGNFWVCHARVRERVRGAFQRNRSVLGGFKPPRTRSVRSQPLRGWKWVRAKVSMSAPALYVQLGIKVFTLGIKDRGLLGESVK